MINTFFLRIGDDKALFNRKLVSQIKLLRNIWGIGRVLFNLENI